MECDSNEASTTTKNIIPNQQICNKNTAKFNDNDEMEERETDENHTCNIGKYQTAIKEEPDMESNQVSKEANSTDENKFEFEHVNIKLEPLILSTSNVEMKCTDEQQVNIKPKSIEYVGCKDDLQIKCEESIIKDENDDDDIMNESRSAPNETQILATTNNSKEGEKELSCNECPYKTTNADNFKSHTQKHVRNCICKYCHETFAVKISLDAHLLEKHFHEVAVSEMTTYKVHKCPSCDYQTVRPRDLKTHVLKHEELTKDMPKFSCEHCNYTTYKNISFVQHLLVHRKDKPFKCEFCDKAFNKKVIMDSHIVHHHWDNKKLMATLTNKIRECQQCSFRCVYSSEFNTHMLRHKGLKPKVVTISVPLKKHSCEHCDYVTSRKHHLTRHLSTHSKGKNKKGD